VIVDNLDTLPLFFFQVKGFFAAGENLDQLQAASPVLGAAGARASEGAH
jgi:hypothetical protein